MENENRMEECYNNLFGFDRVINSHCLVRHEVKDNMGHCMDNIRRALYVLWQVGLFQKLRNDYEIFPEANGGSK